MPYLFGAAIFCVAVALTEANFWADSADYVDSVIAFRLGENYNFWEFGHLFWRPFGWLVWSRFFPAADNNLWRGEVNLIFQSLSCVAGLVSVLALIGILKKLQISGRIIGFAAAGFVFSNAFLNYAQTGTSYVPALMFYLLGLFFALRQTSEKPWLNAILSGVCLMSAVCFWMPFLWTLPAVVCAPLTFYGFSRKNLATSAIQIIAFLTTTALAYGIVLAVLQIDSVNELKAWISDASHGNETRGAARMIFGLARAFVNMGSDGVLFKRFLLKDPYNPVSLAALFGASLWKVAAFYVLAAATSFLLWKTGKNRKIFVLLFLAALPLLIFATLFDGGAVERYLPLFPFAFIGLAAALQTDGYKFLRHSMILLLAVFAIVNISALSVWTAQEQQRKIVSRIESLESKVAPEDTIFLVNWTDDLINFNRSYPFHPSNLRGNLKFSAIVTPGSTQTAEWRAEFAARTLAVWEKGKAVWLSQRAFSEKPQADWNWTEGDDKNVFWREFPEFFGKLETGEKRGDENGFVLVLPTDGNKKILQDFKN